MNDHISREAAKNWIVWSNEHRAFWAPEQRGYTQHIERAGRYTRAEADTICNGANYRSGSDLAKSIPPEIAMPAPEALEGLDSEYCAHCGAQTLLIGPWFIEVLSETLDRAGAPREADGRVLYGITERIEALGLLRAFAASREENGLTQSPEATKEDGGAA